MRVKKGKSQLEFQPYSFTFDEGKVVRASYCVCVCFICVRATLYARVLCARAPGAVYGSVY